MLFRVREDGQGLAEYGMLIVLVAILLVVLLAVFGNQLRGFFTTIVNAWP